MCILAPFPQDNIALNPKFYIYDKVYNLTFYSGFAGDVMGHVVFILEAMVEGTPLQNVLPSSAATYLSLST